MVERPGRQVAVRRPAGAEHLPATRSAAPRRLHVACQPRPSASRAPGCELSARGRPAYHPPERRDTPGPGGSTMDDGGRGRAHVTDTPELAAYYRELEAVNAGGLWTVANEIEPWFPQPRSVPVLWRYREMRPLVLRAGALVTPEQAARRVVMLVNPGRRDVSACVGSLYTGVDHEKLHIRARDLVLTPNWTWHDHGNEGASGPCIWQDGLDIPLVNAL